jgi:hypothetical protein
MKCWVPPCNCAATEECEIVTLSPPYDRPVSHIEPSCSGHGSARDHDECRPFIPLQRNAA